MNHFRLGGTKTGSGKEGTIVLYTDKWKVEVVCDCTGLPRLIMERRLHGAVQVKTIIYYKDDEKYAKTVLGYRSFWSRAKHIEVQYKKEIEEMAMKYMVEFLKSSIDEELLK